MVNPPTDTVVSQDDWFHRLHRTSYHCVKQPLCRPWAKH